MSNSPFSHVSNEVLKFVVTQNRSATVGPRLGSLSLAPRKLIQTPHYVATTSRGSVPHITSDLMRRYTGIASVYIALEDCALTSMALGW